MIARIWRCSARPERVADYVAHFEHSVQPDLRALDGFIDASILQLQKGDTVELTVITRWASMDAIRSFAGDFVEVAVIAPHAQAILESFDRTVTHHEVIYSTPSTL